MSSYNSSCMACGLTIPDSNNWLGRPKRFCSNACRQAAYRFAKNGYEHIRASKRYKIKPVTVAVPTENTQNRGLTLQNAQHIPGSVKCKQFDWSNEDGWVL